MHCTRISKSLTTTTVNLGILHVHLFMLHRLPECAKYAHKMRNAMDSCLESTCLFLEKELVQLTAPSIRADNKEGKPRGKSGKQNSASSSITTSQYVYARTYFT